jgi:hypothetical protein
MPASIVAGRLLLAVAAAATAEAASVAMTGWSKIFAIDSSGCLCAFGKIAAGSDTGTITGSSTYRGIVTYQISGWSGSLSDIGFQTLGASLNPPSLTMPRSADHLYIACVKNAQPLTASPTNYGTVASPGDANGCYCGAATRTLTAQTEDPGAFTGTSFQPIAATIAIPPPTPARTTDFMPFFGMMHNDDELASRRMRRRPSGLHAPAYCQAA